MENRLELNKKPVYELPDEVIVGKYERRKVNGRIPDFKPDICITTFGNIKEAQPGKTVEQIWFKSDNNDLINFIKTYDWNKEAYKITTPNLNMWKFKKIILEEFYGDNKVKRSN